MCVRTSDDGEPGQEPDTCTRQKEEICQVCREGNDKSDVRLRKLSDVNDLRVAV